MDKTNVYPLAQYDKVPASAGPPGEVRARWTGEYRAPRRGEWYLSGAIIEAYWAHNDLTQQFHIAVLVRPERTITRWVEV